MNDFLDMNICIKNYGEIEDSLSSLHQSESSNLESIKSNKTPKTENLSFLNKVSLFLIRKENSK